MRLRRPRPIGRGRSPWLMLAVLLGILALTRDRLLPRGALPDEVPATGTVRTGSGPTFRVVRVHDGDTLTVEGSAGPQRVRIFGIDCPERGQPFSDEARKFTAQLAGHDALLRLDPVDTDRLGRLVARVWVGDRDLGEALLSAGLAWHFRRYSQDAGYQAAEDQARAARRGLWSLSDPSPPWSWRRDHPIEQRQPHD